MSDISEGVFGHPCSPSTLTPTRPVLSSSDWSSRYPRRNKEEIANVSHLCPPTKSINKSSLVKSLHSFLPPLSWLPLYRWKEDSINDLVAGLTVAVMHIPQAMAYAILAGVEPKYGIYSSVFPVLMYMLLGTSRHCSMGTSPIAAILTAKVVEVHAESGQYSNIEVAVACSFSMGIIHSALGLFRLGSFKVILTDSLVSGFTVGAAVHVIKSQLKYVLGVDLRAGNSTSSNSSATVTPQGPGNIIFTLIQIFKMIETTNLVTLSMSAISLMVLLTVSIWVGPRVKKICRFPIPIQLVIIVIATIVSHLLDLRDKYGVHVIDDIGEIPAGLPQPILPKFQLVPLVFVGSIPIAVISFVINQGLGIMFAEKHGYKISANQELLASGASNLAGSFFTCIPMAASMSRSLVQEASGARSLLTALVSSSSLIAVLLWLGTYFGSLPVCILASIILSALKGMLLKMKEVVGFYRRSGWDAATWLITFHATVLLDIDLGLVVGIVAAVALVLVRSCLPQVSLLQMDARGEVWLDRRKYVTKETSRVVLQIKGPIQFLSAKYVEFLVMREVRSLGRAKENKAFDGEENRKSTSWIDDGLEKDGEEVGGIIVVLDLSMVSFIDADGFKLLQRLKTSVEGEGIEWRISGLSASIGGQLEKSADKLDGKPTANLFPTYLDAIFYKPKEYYTHL